MTKLVAGEQPLEAVAAPIDERVVRDETASGPAASIVLPGHGASLGDADGQAVLTDEL